MTRTIISLPEDDKRWLDAFGRRRRISSAEVIRRAIKDYRRLNPDKAYTEVLRETAGAWKSLRGDSATFVNRLRDEWERKR